MKTGSSSALTVGDFFFLSPWLLTLLLFWLFPIVASLLLSFTDYRLLADDYNFVGLANFISLFSDSNFLTAVINTLFFTVGTLPFTTLFALLLALLLNSNLPLRRIFQSIYFFPSVVSMVVVAIIFATLYARGGYLTMLFEMLGIPYPENGFLLSDKTALLSIMAMDVWMATGYYMLLFLAALQSIPDELYEAASLEGARWRDKLFAITLPHLKPMLLFIVILNSIKSFQVFVEVFVMTRGGPLNSTFTMVYFVYEEGFQRLNIGYASAAAYLLFTLIALISVVEWKLIQGKRGMHAP